MPAWIQAWQGQCGPQVQVQWPRCRTQLGELAGLGLGFFGAAGTGSLDRERLRKPLNLNLHSALVFDLGNDCPMVICAGFCNNEVC